MQPTSVCPAAVFPLAYPQSLIGSLPQPTRFLLSFVSRLGAPGSSETRFQARAFCCCRPPCSGLLSREREWDLSGLQTFHPVPLLCSRTPVESTCPRHCRPRRCCPRSLDNEGFGDNCISGLTRSFGTCCHTLHA